MKVMCTVDNELNSIFVLFFVAKNICFYIHFINFYLYTMYFGTHERDCDVHENSMWQKRFTAT